MGSPNEKTEQTEAGAKYSVPLSKYQRAASGLLGVPLASAGATAVFITKNNVGATALLILGVILCLLAISGILPARLKAGEYELEVGEIIDQALEVIPRAEEREKFVEAMAESTRGEVREKIEASYEVHVEYEREVLSTIRKIIANDPNLTLSVGSKDPDGWGDAMIYDMSRRHPSLAVEIKYIRSGLFSISPSLSSLIYKIELANEKLGRVKLLVVSNRIATEQVVNRLSRDGVAFVWKREYRNDEALEIAIQEHFGR